MLTKLILHQTKNKILQSDWLDLGKKARVDKKNRNFFSHNKLIDDSRKSDFSFFESHLVSCVEKVDKINFTPNQK